MSLDINTPLGQETLKQEYRAIELFEKNSPGLKYCKTPRKREAALDAMTVRNSNYDIMSIVETKCRNMTFEQFTTDPVYDFKWLITAEKLEKGKLAADLFCVPFEGFLYLNPDDILLVERLYEPGKGWLVEFETKRSRTQKTVNGGSIIRENAYVDMRNSRKICGVD